MMHSQEVIILKSTKSFNHFGYWELRDKSGNAVNKKKEGVIAFECHLKNEMACNGER